MSSTAPITKIEAAPQTPGGVTQYQTTSASGNARMSAMQAGINDSDKLAALQAVQGGARRRKYHGGQATITLPQPPQNIAKDPNANTSFGISNQTTGIQVNQLDQNAQAKLDNVEYVPQPKTGGTRRKRRGGQKWRCYSGGKRKSRRQSKKSSRKSKKSRRK
jgi:hypothetical protein